MSTVMAVLTIPHSFFIVFGGAIVDRISPLTVLLWTRGLLVIFMLALASLVYTETISFWMLYGFAFLLGSLGAFSIPASQAFLPALLPDQQLAKGNAVMMGSLQVAQMLGPLLAGWLIWAIRQMRSIPNTQFDYQSISLAFAVDATFVFFALICLLFIRLEWRSAKHERILILVMQGFRFCWHDQGIRMALSYLILISFFLHGVIMASLPLFTKLELRLAEAAYGGLYAMIGLGTIIGAGLAAIYVRDAQNLSLILLICDLISGVSFFTFGHVFNVFLNGALLLVMGICSGIIMVAGTTWFQMRTPGELMGRVMSVLMFCVIGLIPLSALATGLLIDLSNVPIVIKSAGFIITLLSVIGLLIPKIRTMSQLPTISPQQMQQILRVE